MKKAVQLLNFVLLSNLCLGGGAGFVPGTLVLTNRGHIPIEFVKEYDEALTYDFTANTFNFDTVVKTHRNKATSIVQLGIGKELIQVHSDHAFYLPQKDKWVKARDLVALCKLLGFKNGLKKLKLSNIEYDLKETPVYCLSMLRNQNFCVSRKNIFAHNMIWLERAASSPVGQYVAQAGSRLAEAGAEMMGAGGASSMDVAKGIAGVTFVAAVTHHVAKNGPSVPEVSQVSNDFDEPVTIARFAHADEPTSSGEIFTGTVQSSHPYADVINDPEFQRLSCQYDCKNDPAAREARYVEFREYKAKNISKSTPSAQEASPSISDNSATSVAASENKEMPTIPFDNVNSNATNSNSYEESERKVPPHSAKECNHAKKESEHLNSLSEDKNSSSTSTSSDSQGKYASYWDWVKGVVKSYADDYYESETNLNLDKFKNPENILDILLDFYVYPPFSESRRNRYADPKPVDPGMMNGMHLFPYRPLSSFNTNAKPEPPIVNTGDYIADNRVPDVNETILKGVSFVSTGKKWGRAQIFKKDDKYYLINQFEKGKYGHLDVYDNRGYHLGEADLQTGKLFPNTAYSAKFIGRAPRGYDDLRHEMGKKSKKEKEKTSSSSNNNRNGGSSNNNDPDNNKDKNSIPPVFSKEKKRHGDLPQRRLTNKEQRQIAKENGWVEKGRAGEKGEIVFQEKKTGRLFSHDIDGHNGGVWKELDRAYDRTATCDRYGNVFKG